MGVAQMYDTYIYASYAATFVPLLLLIGFSFKHLADARGRLAVLENVSNEASKNDLGAG